MKKNIFAPEVRIIRFDNHDVIVTSISSGTTGTTVKTDGVIDDDGYSDNQFAPGRYNSGIWD